MHQNIDSIELLRALNAEATEYLIIGGLRSRVVSE